MHLRPAWNKTKMLLHFMSIYLEPILLSSIACFGRNCLTSIIQKRVREIISYLFFSFLFSYLFFFNSFFQFFFFSFSLHSSRSLFFPNATLISSSNSSKLSSMGMICLGVFTATKMAVSILMSLVCKACMNYKIIQCKIRWELGNSMSYREFWPSEKEITDLWYNSTDAFDMYWSDYPN